MCKAIALPRPFFSCGYASPVGARHPAGTWVTMANVASPFIHICLPDAGDSHSPPFLFV